MTTITAILETSSQTRSHLTNLIVKYCPTLEINLDVNSIKDLLNLPPKQLPEIIFFNPCKSKTKEIDLLYKKSLSIESVLLLEQEKALHCPINYFHPSGYLFLPIDEELLIVTVENVKQVLTLKKQNKFFSLNQVGIPSPNGLDFIAIDNIIRCESLTNCTKVILSPPNRSLISSYNIGEFKKLLHSFGFFSPHKSHLINLSFVNKYKREGIIFMKGDNKTLIPVARHKRKEFLSLITRL